MKQDPRGYSEGHVAPAGGKRPSGQGKAGSVGRTTSEGLPIGFDESVLSPPSQGKGGGKMKGDSHREY